MGPRDVTGVRRFALPYAPADLTEVRFSTFVGTHEVYKTATELIAHNESCFLALMRHVQWHDERGGCPTWTGDVAELGGRCCCDVEAA